MLVQVMCLLEYFNNVKAVSPGEVDDHKLFAFQILCYANIK